MKKNTAASRRLGAVGCVLWFLAACFNPVERAQYRDKNPHHITIGAQSDLLGNFIAEIFRQDLEQHGYTVIRRYPTGSRERYIPALRGGDIDLVPEYLGNFVFYLNSTIAPTSLRAQYDQMRTQKKLTTALHLLLPPDLAALDISRAHSNDSVTVTEKFAQKYHLHTISDLARYGKTHPVTLMATSEFGTRSIGIPGLERRYNMHIRLIVNNDDGGPSTVRALLAGQVTCADVYTTSPLIVTDHLRVLIDDRRNFPMNLLFPLLASAKKTPELERVLNPIMWFMTDDDLRAAMIKITGPERVEIVDAAKDWMRAHQQQLDRAIAGAGQEKTHP